ncbi:MAG: glycosyltransferase [Prevotellaceae bacterium]|nr:glycosyltransferase [Prevotellaceae bacterium]
MITLISISLLFLYTLLILIFERGWRRTPLFSAKEKNVRQQPFLSVVVCARNEEKNLPKLLQAIKNQSYKNFELIIVNDRSTDKTESIVHSFTTENPNFSVINAKKEGKKSALKDGIAASSGEIIVQTDADCIPTEKWLETIAAYLAENESDLVIGAVKMNPVSAFEEMQALEFMSLVASGAGAAAMGMPVMCNGANLIYKRSLWNEAVKAQHEEFASGDDMFLLLAAKKLKKKITFLKSVEATITTKAEPALSVFLRQRRRWASKSAGYRDFAVLLTAFSVFGVAVLFLLLLLTGNFNLLLFVFLWKGLIDFFFLSSAASFFNLQKCLKWVFPVAAIYPFYIVYAALAGLYGRKKW